MFIAIIYLWVENYEIFYFFFLSIFSHFSTVGLYYSLNLNLIRMCLVAHSAESCKLSSLQLFQECFAHSGLQTPLSP